MGLFSGQLANVIEWEEFRDDMIFWKWNNQEIKKGSRLIIRPGQDAIFLSNGRIEGIFRDDGDYDIESDIIPFLSTLKGFRFGFNSGMRAEILFINTKEFQEKWGTRNPIHIPTQQLPGGLPIRSNGTFTFRVNDYIALIDNIAGVRQSYLVEDLKERILSILNPLLMKWITKEGKDMFNLQANAFDISKGICSDLDMELMSTGLAITNFNIMSFNYPENVQKMIERAASQSMIGDVNRYQQVSMVDSMTSGQMHGGSSIASDMASMVMGINMANQMAQNLTQPVQSNTHNQQNNTSTSNQTNYAPSATGSRPNFCPNCGVKTGTGNFCANCGIKLV